MALRCLRTAAAVATAAALALLPAIARGGDPTLAGYVADGSRIFWFLWIADTHIEYVLPLIGPGDEEDRLGWALTEVVEVVGPAFVVATGDLTDGTNGPLYTGHVESEWLAYRGILEESGMTPDFYFDVAGNHDAYSDGDLEMYLAHSMQGSAHSTTQPSFRLELEFGSYHFLEVSTAGNDGAAWPFDNSELTNAELAEAEGSLTGSADARLSMVFGHHDFVSVSGASTLRELMLGAGAAHYFHGHEHDYGVRLDVADDIVRTRIDSLGQGWSSSTLAVVAVDADAVSLGIGATFDAWPLIVVTAPVDARLGPENDVANPYAPPVPITCTEAPLRVLVFDLVEPEGVSYSWDGDPAVDMVVRPDRAVQWRSRFDATALEPGLHDLTVEADGSSLRSTTIQVELVDAPCEVGEEDPAPEPDGDADVDGDGDWDADLDVDPDSGPDGDADLDAEVDLEEEPEVDGAVDGDSDVDWEPDAEPGNEDDGEAGGCSCSSGGVGRPTALGRIAAILGLPLARATR